MSFLNVDQEELYLIFVFMIEIVKRGNLPPKRRSGIAAEHQYHRFFSSQRRELNGSLLV
jgi:hypothetical protein